ncbi:hypothetical protein ACWGID_20390 [Kribbella sp. NPDC054772]
MSYDACAEQPVRIASIAFCRPSESSFESFGTTPYSLCSRSAPMRHFWSGLCFESSGRPAPSRYPALVQSGRPGTGVRRFAVVRLRVGSFAVIGVAVGTGAVPLAGGGAEALDLPAFFADASAGEPSRVTSTTMTVAISAPSTKPIRPVTAILRRRTVPTPQVG